MALDLTPFRRAVGQLASGLAAAEAAPGDELMRDGVIQRFAYTYALSHRFLRRFREETEPSSEKLHELSVPGLIRLGAERGLLRHSWDVGTEHRKARGTTSHTYDGVKAAEVFARIPAFLDDARAAGGARTAARAVTAGLDVEPRWLSVVLRILGGYAPRPCRVWAFGSRVTGRARRFSDLDLALDAGRRLTLGEEAILAEAFDESDLPWRVDVVDLVAASERFRAEVERQAVPLFAAPPPP